LRLAKYEPTITNGKPTSIPKVTGSPAKAIPSAKATAVFT
jgi:hypothetical protein